MTLSSCPGTHPNYPICSMQCGRPWLIHTVRSLNLLLHNRHYPNHHQSTTTSRHFPGLIEEDVGGVTKTKDCKLGVLTLGVTSRPKTARDANGTLSGRDQLFHRKDGQGQSSNHKLQLWRINVCGDQFNKVQLVTYMSHKSLWILAGSTAAATL